MVFDPVCNMTVDIKSKEKKLMYKEITYHFCSTLCKELFDKSPEKYLENNRKNLSKIIPLPQSLINTIEIEV